MINFKMNKKGIESPLLLRNATFLAPPRSNSEELGICNRHALSLSQYSIFKLNKKAMEMKIVMMWLFVIIVTILVLFLIGIMGGRSFNVVETLSHIF